MAPVAKKSAKRSLDNLEIAFKRIPASKASLRSYAKKRFEILTKTKWSRELEARVRHVVGTPPDPRSWIADFREAERFKKALTHFLEHCASGGTSFREAINRLSDANDSRAPIPSLRRALDDAPHNSRRETPDKRLIRFFDLQNFLGLGRRAIDDELVCMSILAVSDFGAFDRKTTLKYWRDHAARIRGLRRKKRLRSRST